MNRNRLYTVLVALLLLGAVARITGAWCFRNNTNPDCGIVHLMAKHMAEGKEAPVFFYGQPYMGSLEPATSALLCKLFTVSGFWVCMGTAVYGVLCLLMIYLWARDAAGPTAGLAAVGFCVLGPRVFFLYQFAPRGGYMATLFLGLFVVWMTCRLVVRERDDRPAHWTAYVLLGVAAGLGWWSNQIITFNLLTAALLFLVGLRLRVFTARIASGVAGFFVGGFPLWAWNARHDWATFGFLDSPARGDFVVGLRYLLGPRLHDLLGIGEAHPFTFWVSLGVLATLAMAGVWALFAVLSGRRDSASRIYLLAACLFLLVATLVFAKSHFSRFNTARYLVPFVPALAVILGAGTAELVRRLPYGVGWAPLVILVGLQTRVLPELPNYQHDFAEWHNRAERLAAGLREQGLSAVYTPFTKHWLNFALDEEFVFSDLQHERYHPYTLVAEQEDRVGVLGNYGNIDAFIHASLSTRQNISVRGLATRHGFTRPAMGLAEIEPKAWSTAIDSTGSSLLAEVTDRNLETRWRSAVDTEDEEWVEIEFKNPVEISMVRMLSNHRYGYPPRWRLLGAATPDGEWEELAPEYSYSTYYWSGPRPYWGGATPRFECRLEPRRVKRVRLERTRGAKPWTWALTELQVFGPAEPRPAEKASFDVLLSTLQERGISRLFCDRWVANTIHKDSSVIIETPLEAGIFEQTALTAGGPVHLTAGCGLLVRAEDAQACRDVLGRWNVAMRETALAPWVLFDFGPGDWQDRYAGRLPLRWHGFACFTGGVKDYSADLIAREEKRIGASGVTAESLAVLREALDLYPNHLTTLPLFPSWLRQLGMDDEADDVETRQKHLTTPSVPAPIRFSRDIAFLGLTADKQRLRRGESTRIRYFWSVSSAVAPWDTAVFVHAVNGNARFQDDHVLLSSVDHGDIAYQPRAEVFHQDRVLTVPEDVMPGYYVVRFGLHDRNSGIRLRPATDLSTEDRAVVLPLRIEVRP